MSEIRNEPPQTLPQVIRRAAVEHAARLAVVDGDVHLTYAELSYQTERVARSLLALGVQAGDRVAIWAPNVHEWILAACGIHAAGAVLVPVNTRMRGEEVADIVGRSRARVLFCIGNFLDRYYPDLLEGFRPATLEHVVVLREASPSHGDMSWEDFLGQAERIPAARVAEREAALDGDSVADVMFTSGTTGRPKGVMAGHRATILAFSEWAKVIGLNEGDRYLIINPFFHAFGYKAGWIAAFLRGATVYPHLVFDASSVLSRIEAERITFLPGPPTLFLSMLAHPDLATFDISSLRATVTGAATVPPVLIERMRNELGFSVVTTAYGLTECGGCATLCDPSDSAETVAMTCGRALPGTEVRCVDAENRPVQVGEAGEVVLRGFHVMKGYFEDEKATRETIDADGWLHTGDVGVLDARGYLRITDRLKDMFIVGGFNCYPAEIERVLAEHPDIAQVAVTGVPDERMGEVGCACVILRHGATLDEAGMIAWSRERMANYKVPRHILAFDEFPLNASNKVLKRDLAQLAAGRLAAAA
ncbi:fatty acid--CoA ligase [Pandoraea terrae]|uniref:Fatty acid--CoA ligase n=1 Tax=Pandoraea terrae TaxID=1537710 RepID=A0A5E4YV23_9BURK|nr:FadD3 family acyl-CoA ligase [Pandoraea terrae]VVE52711.1 fatty acid--CoA ligase [Pandoraea terrae]